MRHFSFPLPIAGHPPSVIEPPLAAALVAPAGILQRDVARDVGAFAAAVDLAMVAAGANERLGAARETPTKIASTNRKGIHRLAPCQADQLWTGRPPVGMGYLIHIPYWGLQGTAPVKLVKVWVGAVPAFFCAAKSFYRTFSLRHLF